MIYRIIRHNNGNFAIAEFSSNGKWEPVDCHLKFEDVIDAMKMLGYKVVDDYTRNKTRQLIYSS